GLDLGIVVRVVLREKRDRAPVQHLEAARRVGDALAGDQRNRAREDADADASRRRRPEAVRARKARADTDVGVSGEDHVEERPELGWVVLAVSVDADGDVIVVLRGVAKAGLHGTADAEVERESE